MSLAMKNGGISGFTTVASAYTAGAGVLLVDDPTQLPVIPTDGSVFFVAITDSLSHVGRTYMAGRQVTATSGGTLTLTGAALSNMTDHNAPTTAFVFASLTKEALVQLIADAATAGSFYQTIQAAGTDQTQRGKLDFVGTGVSVSDDATNGRTVVTITAGSVGGGGGSGPSVATALLQFAMAVGGSVTLPQAVGVGHLICVCCTYEGGSDGSTVTDNLSTPTVYTQAVIAHASGQRCVLFYGITTVSGIPAITVTSGGSWVQIGAAEVVGYTTPDGTASIGSGHTLAFTVATANDFVFAAMDTYTNSSNPTALFPLTPLDYSNTSDSLGMGCMIAPAAQAFMLSFSDHAAPGASSGVAAMAFKA